MFALNSSRGFDVTARATHATFHIAYIASVLFTRPERFILGAIGHVMTTASRMAAAVTTAHSRETLCFTAVRILSLLLHEDPRHRWLWVSRVAHLRVVPREGLGCRRL